MIRNQTFYDYLIFLSYFSFRSHFSLFFHLFFPYFFSFIRFFSSFFSFSFHFYVLLFHSAVFRWAQFVCRYGYKCGHGLCDCFITLFQSLSVYPFSHPSPFSVPRPPCATGGWLAREIAMGTLLQPIGIISL